MPELDRAIASQWILLFPPNRHPQSDSDRHLTPVESMRADAILEPGTGYALWLDGHIEASVDSSWSILWESDELLAVVKPAGLPVSRTTRNLFDTLATQVRRFTPYEDAHLLHRLDAETSGILLMAKTPHANRKWKKRLDKLMVAKGYLALVSGRPDWETLDYECLLAGKFDSPIRSQVYAVEPDLEGWVKPKSSRTLFRRLTSFEGPNGVCSLVRAELMTGRKHQIRAQLAHLGHPIIGDKIYSHQGRYYLKRFDHPLDEQDFQTLGSPHHLLHAVDLTLNLYGETRQLSAKDNLPNSWPGQVREWLFNAGAY